MLKGSNGSEVMEAVRAVIAGRCYLSPPLSERNNSQIAARLFISRRTVETHRANVFQKLELHSQTDLVRYALCRGIIRLDE